MKLSLARVVLYGSESLFQKQLTFTAGVALKRRIQKVLLSCTPELNAAESFGEMKVLLRQMVTRMQAGVATGPSVVAVRNEFCGREGGGCRSARKSRRSNSCQKLLKNSSNGGNKKLLFMNL